MIKVDKERIYESHGYKFKNFAILSLEEKLMILEWRNSEKVRNVMVHKTIIEEKDHFHFIEGLKQRNDCFYWLVIGKKEEYLGVLDVIHIDYQNNVGEIGYYLNPYEIGNGFYFMIECQYFVFSQLELGTNLVTVNIRNREIILFKQYLGGSFEGIEKIEDERFLVNKHANGDYIINHYKDFNLIDFARFVKNNKELLTELIYKMELQDFIRKFAEQFDETEPSTIHVDTEFRCLDEWSSLIGLSIIAMVDEEFDVALTGDDIKSSKTVKDLYDRIIAKK